MMSEQAFKRLISGDSPGIAAFCARTGLSAVSPLYRLAMAIRNASFDHGLRNITTVGVPVISIGNLTTGGTGKTPIVATVVNMLRDMHQQPGIVSRGYRANDSGFNDEKRVLDQLCSDVPHEQNPDRVAAAAQLIHDASVSTIVLDDAFQHRRIHRDLDIVLIDATCPFGFGHILPRGLLREPTAALKRADVVLITRANLVDAVSLQQIEGQIRRRNADLADTTFRVTFQPTSLLTAAGEQPDLATLDSQRVVVATAIGNPDGFVKTCEGLGATVAVSQFFPDHHQFSEADVTKVIRLAEQHDCSRVLVTLKDMVKIPATFDDIAAVLIETVFERTDDEATFRQVVESAILSNRTKTS